MTTQATVTHHRRAVRFFWSLLIGATSVSLVGNVTHAVLPYVPHVLVQIGAAAVPPVVLLAAVHGIGLAVRAGASGGVYWWALGAVGAIGVGAFTVSFLALQDLMQSIGYGATTACAFPAIVDTAVAVSTLMLVALGDKPARRNRSGSIPPPVQTASGGIQLESGAGSAKRQPKRPRGGGAPDRDQALTDSESAQTTPLPPGIVGEPQGAATQNDADIALALVASGVTTQPIDTVIAVLRAHRNGASINAAARTSSINYRTAQRIIRAADRQQLAKFALVS